jgi:hypothetical protein
MAGGRRLFTGEVPRGEHGRTGEWIMQPPFAPRVAGTTAARVVRRDSCSEGDMGILDKIFDKDDDKDKRKADFSNVQSGGSSTAPAPKATAPRADSSLNPSLADSPASAGRRTYTVKAGDSLSKIAKHEYGDAAQWHKIYEANKDTIKDPDLIYPGQTFTLP